MTIYEILQQTQRERVSNGEIQPILSGCESANRVLVLIWPQLGDFDSLEYAWWLQQAAAQIQSQGIVVRAVGIGDRTSGERFCQFTGFPTEQLFIDPKAELHQQLELYKGLSTRLPGLTAQQNAWLNLMLMCAGIGSPGTLKEVLRGYTGDRQAPQLIADDQVVRTGVLPPMKGTFFKFAGGKGFQRPFELATLRLRNMTEVLGNWSTYVPDARYLTQRGATFLFDRQGQVLYEYRDPAILGFAENKSEPLTFLQEL